MADLSTVERWVDRDEVDVVLHADGVVAKALVDQLGTASHIVLHNLAENWNLREVSQLMLPHSVLVVDGKDEPDDGLKLNSSTATHVFVHDGSSIQPDVSHLETNTAAIVLQEESAKGMNPAFHIVSTADLMEEALMQVRQRVQLGQTAKEIQMSLSQSYGSTRAWNNGTFRRDSNSII